MRRNVPSVLFWMTLLPVAAWAAPAAAQAHVDLRTAPPLPSVPARVFKVVDYGAKGDGTAHDTAALQTAIDACSQAGGGTVSVPPGRYLTGPITLASRIDLRLEKGATLLLSDNPADYKQTGKRFEDAIIARDAHDVALTGGGTIDGQGGFWWKNYVKPKSAPAGTPDPPHRPHMIVLTRCTRVLIRDVTLTNSPNFHLVPQQCRDVTIQGIHILAPENAPNTDGIDPSGWNYRITDCTIDVGDDCIAVKPAGRIEPGQPSCRDFLITHCRFLHGHGMSIGGQTPGGLENLTVRDCTFQDTQAGIRMKASRGQGGLVQNLTYENLTMHHVKVAILITSFYPRIPGDPALDPAQPVADTTPIWRHIRIRNVTAEGGDTAGRILGLAEMPIEDLVMTEVHIKARKGMDIVHAKGVRLLQTQVTAEQGASLTTHDAEVGQ